MSDIVQQLDLFSATLPKIKLEGKTIKVIECFAGIGSQYQALKILSQYSNGSFKAVSHKIVEWAYNSYVMYNEMHIKDFTDYSIGKTKEEMLDRIRGTSTNYNTPLNDRQLTKKPIEWIKRAYNSCIATNNLVNIMNVHGDDLEITKNENDIYILTYSFPCQDISLSGKCAGLEKSQAEGGTRSGLLWEIERILDELSIKNNLPEILLLENVPPLLSEANGNLKQFQKWEQKLGSLGYTNFVKILNGKEFGIPQNRERVFCISILGQYTYNFPAKIPLKYKLKDFLDSNVDEKYFLDEETIERISNWKAREKPLENAIDITKDEEQLCGTLTARGAGEDHSGMKLIKYTEKSMQRIANNVCEEDTTPTITANAMQSINHQNCVLIKNNTKKGYLAAEVGDGIDISGRMENHRGTVQKEVCQTLSTLGGQNVGVVVDEKRK